MLTRCGMLLHSFQMQRRLTWSHPPKAAVFFPFSFFGFTMSELYESMPTNNGRWRLYQHPCMVRIMQSGEFRRWWSTRQILYMPIIPWKKNFFYTICKAYLCVEKQRRVWHERKTAMQACRAQQLTLLTCWPVTISAGSSLIRSGYAARWSGRLLSGGLWQLDGQSFSCTATAWKPRRLGPVELAMNKCS